MKKGFTLIEIIIGVAVLSILTLMLSSIFMFSLKSYGNGEGRHDEQFDVRFAMDLIEEDIRNSMTLEFLTSQPVNTLNNYVYYDGSAIRIGKDSYPLPQVTDITFDLTEDDNRLILTVNVTGDDDFNLSTDIMFNNLSSHSYRYDHGIDDSDPVDMTGENSIMYTKPGE